jgi:hypothetical protein
MQKVDEGEGKRVRPSSLPPSPLDLYYGFALLKGKGYKAEDFIG